MRLNPFGVFYLRVAAGQRVLALIGAAGHDPDVVADPAAFQPNRRQPSQHLASGHGPYHRLGTALARLDLSTALRVLAEHHPQLTLAGHHRQSRPQPSCAPTAHSGPHQQQRLPLARRMTAPVTARAS